MIYQWKSGARIRADANAAGAQFEALEKSVGLSAETVLDANRPEDAPLHDEFEWQDDIAAEEWRKHQARHLINCICITAESEDEPEAPVRAFFKTTESREYENLQTIITHADKRRALLETALRELTAFERKYHTIEALTPVFRAIEEVRA